MQKRSFGCWWTTYWLELLEIAGDQIRSVKPWSRAEALCTQFDQLVDPVSVLCAAQGGVGSVSHPLL